MSPDQSQAERSPQDLAKEAAGRHAASYVTDGMRVGLGTGSTVHWTIVELGDRALDIVCTSTSVQTQELAISLGLKVISPDEIGALDIAIDGADEVDPAFNLTKGGGAAHTREKIVASMSPRFIIVVDDDVDIRDWKEVIWAMTTRMDPVRDTVLIENTPIDYLDFASPVSGLGSKIGFDATNKWPGETTREWGTPIVMDPAVKARVDEIWQELSI